MTNDFVAGATWMTNDWFCAAPVRAMSDFVFRHGGAAAVIEAQQGHSS